MNQAKNILVGIDLSPNSQNALKEAARLAASGGAQLHVGQVATADVIEDYQELFDLPTDDILARMGKELSRFVEDAIGTGHSATIHTVLGHPFVELIRLAKKVEAGALVLGSRGWSDERGSAGVIATKCVRKAPLPVLLVRNAQIHPFRRVVACVDFSDTSKKALDEAAEIAAIDGAELYILHAHCPPWMYPTNVEYDLHPIPASEYQEQYKAMLDDRMKAFADPIRERFPDLKVEAVIRQRENVWYAIVDYLKEAEADLAVLGTRGRTGIKILLLGTTAERIIHESPCSVLAVKPDGFEYDVD
ncbi:MAG: universal stress protein [Verrucomicrobiales bacterium]